MDRARFIAMHIKQELPKATNPRQKPVVCPWAFLLSNYTKVEAGYNL
jgi:hypothetical protein